MLRRFFASSKEHHRRVGRAGANQGLGNSRPCHAGAGRASRLVGRRTARTAPALFSRPDHRRPFPPDPGRGAVVAARFTLGEGEGPAPVDPIKVKIAKPDIFFVVLKAHVTLPLSRKPQQAAESEAMMETARKQKSAPARNRLTPEGKAARQKRIFARMRAGWACDAIAREEGLTARRVRQIVSRALDRRELAGARRRRGACRFRGSPPCSGPRASSSLRARSGRSRR